MKKKYTALGLMSGTSLDGIDVAMITSDGGEDVARAKNMFVAFNDAMRARIEQGLETAKAITSCQQRPGDLSVLEHDLTDLHAHAVLQFLHDNNLNADDIDLVGFHGQTVLHRPMSGLSVQLADGQALANAIGIEVVYDMRANDMVCGGQGAPLVPVYHRALAASLTFKRNGPLAFVNIGGISNVTYIGEHDQLIAFDCGPGNGLIDQWIKKHTGREYDEGGKLAAQGEVDNTICTQYLNNSYFDEKPPKSLDRNDFQPLDDDKISLHDGARTLANITASAIIKSCDHFPAAPANWIICGGGALNEVIVEDLRQLAGGRNGAVFLAEEVGLDAMAMEAEAFAYLAIRAKLGLPLTFPTTTGCDKAVSGGVFAGAGNEK